MPEPQDSRVTQLMNDPISLFNQSITRMHMIDREELEELQRQAMSIRFQEHYQSIEIMRKLADLTGGRYTYVP